MAEVINRRDLDFLLFEWLKVGDLEDLAPMLDLAQDIAEREVAPYLRAADLNEPFQTPDGQVHVLPEVARGVRTIAEAGIFRAVFDEELDGLQLPHTIYVAMMGMLMGGSISTASYLLLTVANARLIAAFGTPAQIAAFTLPQLSGEALGTMCLSEPQAGSSLADIRTRAVPDGEDELGPRYRIRGAKMWISAGDQDISRNIVHLVLAKSGAEEGTRGISLFIVPKFLPDGSRNDVAVAGLNHKMGYRGIPNCALNFGEKEGAIGWRVGEAGQGLPQMFQMMNEARISVGLGGAMLAYRGFLLSLDYARTRAQGRPFGQRGGEPVAIVEHPDVKRMLLAQKAYAEGALALVLYSARLLDEGGEEAEELLALLTPVTKTFPSEWAQISLHHAIQIHGGAGYTRDFEVELLYRDNRLNPIHEGTTGIQGIDLINRKILRDRGLAFARLERHVENTVLAAKGLEIEAKALQAAWDQLEEAVRTLLARDPAAAIVHGNGFLEAMGHVVVGWLWLDQAVLCAAHPDSAFHRGKLAACRYFAEYELPKVAGFLAPLMADSPLTRTMAAEEFTGA